MRCARSREASARSFPSRLRVDPEAVEAAPGLLEPEVREALRLAAQNIEAVARAELEVRARPAAVELPEGQAVEVREEPIAAVGVYVPGGRAAYPSSVLMCAIPARVAGAARVAVASPPGAAGRPNAAVLAACSIAGVKEVYAVGGAQAIAALAFGTETIERVDLVAGPGNRYVQEAKRLVSAAVGIDGIAGPSELMVVADGTANPEWIALDVCAQAEHGDDSLVIVASPDRGPARAGRASWWRGWSRSARASPRRPWRWSRRRASRRRCRSPTPWPPSTWSSPSRAPIAPPPEGGSRAACSSAAEERRRSATTRPAPTTSCRRAAPLASAGRSGRAPSGAGPRSSASRGPPPRALAPHVAALARAEGLPVHGESAEARAGP